MSKRPLLLVLPILLAACAQTLEGPLRGPLVAEGNPVRFGTSTEVAGLIVTPMRVVEDSRCPINARCVWAGRITVETMVDGPGWRDTLPLTLGEPQVVGGYRLALVSAEPGRLTTEDAPEAEHYRFVYEGSAESGRLTLQ